MWLTVPWVGVLYIIVVFRGHTHLPFLFCTISRCVVQESMILSGTKVKGMTIYSFKHVENDLLM